MVWSTAIQVMISIQSIQITLKQRTNLTNMPTNRVSNFGAWHKNYIAAKCNRPDRPVFYTTFNRLIIIWIHKQSNQQNCDFCPLNCYHCRRIIHKVHCTNISAIGCLCARFFSSRTCASPLLATRFDKMLPKYAIFVYCVKSHNFIYDFYCRYFCFCWFWDLFFVFICWKRVSIKW